MLRISCLIFYFICFIDVLSAQGDTAAGRTADSIWLEPLLVKGYGVLSPTDLQVDSTDLNRFAFNTLADMLSFSTAFAIKDYGPGQIATAAYRGAGARHSLVRWNGMRLNSPMHGTVDLSALAVAGLRSARLVSGSAASAQSGMALGGLLELESGPSADAPGLSAELAGSLGSFAQSQAQGSVEYVEDRWALRSSGAYAYADLDFPVQHPVLPPFSMPSAQYRRWFTAQDISIKSGESGQWTVALAGNGSSRLIPPALQVSDQREEQEDQLWLGSAQYQNQFGAWALQWRAGWMDEQFAYRNELAGIYSEGRAMAGESALNWSRYDRSSRWKWEGGYTLRREHIQSSGYAEDFSAWELRLQQSVQYALSPRLFLRTDLLQDRYDGDWQPFQPVVRFFYQEPQAKVWRLSGGAGAARHYARPSQNDRWWLPGGHPELLPEQGWMLDADLSLRYAKDEVQAHLQALVWTGRIDQWIQWAPQSASYWEASNLHQVNNRGLELRSSFGGNMPWLAAAFWNLEMIYAYTRARTGEQSYLLYQPDHRYTGRASIRAKRWSLGLRQSGSSWRPTRTDGTAGLPANVLLSADLNAWFYVGSWKMETGLIADNLLNSYFESVINRPQPGRSFRLQLIVKTNYK